MNLKNKRIFALGETLLDILFENNQPIKAVPGGSMLNAAVSLGRMGTAVELLSEFGSDPAGAIISGFLQLNSVGTTYSHKYRQHKTSIAMAFLDTARNATYSFYHDIPDRIPGYRNPGFTMDDILLFGSFYSINPSRRDIILALLHSARSSDCIRLFDPNIRKNQTGFSAKNLESIRENMSLSSITKGSDEDFAFLFETDDPESIYEKVKEYCPLLIITSGSKAVKLFTPSLKASYSVPEIVPVSTIGAGDNFNAGILFGIISLGLNSADLPGLEAEKWNKIIGCGISFAKETCLSMENYIPRGLKNLDPESN